jgi:co-chaperonin GroES (HSP10)
MKNLQELFETELPAFEDRSASSETGVTGIEPKGHLVLVLPDFVPRESKGGIALPDDTVERDEMAQIFARVVLLGPNCWYDEGGVKRAKVGDRVMIAKFAGQLVTGGDGKRYRVINDKDVLCVITGEVKK